MIAFWTGLADLAVNFTPPPWMLAVFFFLCVVLATESRRIRRFLRGRAEAQKTGPEGK